jgi:hypothetical protein
MSTRSLIGIENTDGTVTFAYCHFDGYPSGVGRDIVDMGRLEARSLIKEGDMSTVGEHYHSSRGEPWEDVKPKTAKDVREFLSVCVREHGCDYAYVLKRSGAWMYGSYSDSSPRSLKVALKSEG